MAMNIILITALITLVKCNNEDFYNLNFGFLFAEKNVITGPRCIPLKSKNILANPYHSSLLSRKGGEVRRGLGIPQILNQNPLSCPIDSPKDCTFNVDKTFSTSVSNSYSISMSNSKSISKSLGTTNSTEKGNSVSKSISNSAEQVLSSQISQANEETISDQINNQYSSSHEKSTGITTSNAKEVSETNAISQDTKNAKTNTQEKSSSDSKNEEFSHQISFGGSESSSNNFKADMSWHAKAGVEASGKAGIPFVAEGEVKVSAEIGSSIGIGYERTNTDEKNWNQGVSNSKSTSKTESESLSSSELFEYNNGKSNSKSNSHSSSSSEENTAVDTISVALEKINQNSRTKSLQNETTESKGSTYTISEDYNSNENTNIAHNLNEENTEQSSATIEKSNQTTFTVSVSANQGFTVKPGECKILVCYPFVFSVAVPYDCISENGLIERVNTDIMLIDSTTMLKGNLTCAQSLINCEDKDKGNIFLNNKVELNLALKNVSSTTHFDYGKDFYSNKDKNVVLAISDNLNYQFVLLSDGNLVIKLNKITVWQTQMTFFSNFTTRIRINEKGHLIQESQDLFTNTYPNYRNQEWLTVWSSAPINHNVTIGIPFNNGRSYILILSDTGVLNMYDSVGALIWCTDKDCAHRFGYKFPEVYLVPILSNSSNFSTPFEPNNHNSISRSVEKSPFKNKISIQKSCTGLETNKAIVSSNQRFKLILEESGNLVIKDGIRTMWESLSANINYAVGPYELLIGPTGNLIIRSKNEYVIWMSVPNYEKTLNNNKSKNLFYKMKLLDAGHLVIVNEYGNTIWDSFPMNGMNNGITFYRPIEYKFLPCHGKPLINKKYLITTETNNTLYAHSNIISGNGIWDLVILDKNKLVIRKLYVIKYEIFSSLNDIDQLVINNNGYIELLNNKNELVWSHMYLNLTSLSNDAINGPFILELNNNGELIIKDNKNSTIWNFKENILMKYDLISDQINTLKYGQYLESINGNDFELRFYKNNLKLFKGYQFISDLFSEQDCSNKVLSEPDKIELLNGKIDMLDENDDIICEIKFENNNDAPFRLVLNDETVEIYNRFDLIVWQKKL